MSGSTGGWGSTSLNEMHHISIHVCASCVLGGGRISCKGLIGELVEFKRNSSDHCGIRTTGGTRDDNCYEENHSMEWGKPQ
jgi:hypothetical protein